MTVYRHTIIPRADNQVEMKRERLAGCGERARVHWYTMSKESESNVRPCVKVLPKPLGVGSFGTVFSGTFKEGAGRRSPPLHPPLCSHPSLE
jgi:hypothetical protein